MFFLVQQPWAASTDSIDLLGSQPASNSPLSLIDIESPSLQKLGRPDLKTEKSHFSYLSGCCNQHGSPDISLMP